MQDIKKMNCQLSPCEHDCVKTGTPVLEVKGLAISFTQYDGAFTKRGLDTIKNLNIAVDAGEMVAVVGASGSGKSLLAHAILGILPYNASSNGDMCFMGEKLTQKRIEELRGHEIVLVPQSVSYLDPLMKVGKQLELGGKKKENKSGSAGAGTSALKKRIRSVFTRYRLPEGTEDLYPFELSGGMARRVLISSAVLEKPKLVIADEPTPGLHIDVAKQVLSHFREMADEGAGVLLITHDLELAIEAADRIVVFYDGESIDEVRPADFRNAEEALRPGCDKEISAILKHPYTRALWQALPKHW